MQSSDMLLQTFTHRIATPSAAFRSALSRLGAYTLPSDPFRPSCPNKTQTQASYTREVSLRSTMIPSLLRRHKDRGAYDLEKVTSVFADCFMAHVAYCDDGMPQCIPMIALFHEIDGQTSIYLHGHPSARLMELVKKSERNSTNCPKQKPVKVCVTATKVDGLVLSSAPNGHTFQYRSAIVHGTCFTEHDLHIKREIMRGVTNHIIPNRWETVNPVASAQISLVSVVKVEINSMSVKFRQGVPGIQPRNIEKDGPDREEPVWTGAIPLFDTLAQPIPSGLTPLARLPTSIDTFVQERNQRHAESAIARSQPPSITVRNDAANS